MKNSKKIKLVLMVLICVMIILIGFIGIYLKQSNSYKNILPKYELASDLKGSTVLELEVDDSTETIYYDKDGKEVDSTKVTEENEKDYTKKEIAINAEENLNKENYKKVAKIMQERLDFLQTNQYRIDLDEKTGKIVITYDDDYPEDIESILPMEGKFELVDTNTEDVILDYNDFNFAETTYATLDDGSYVVYINLKLNKSGVEKINNIDKYKTNVEEQEETKVNNFKIIFDSEEVAEVSYDDMLLINKTLRIETADNLTSNSDINSQLNKNTIICKLATMGKVPVIYNITAQEYIIGNEANYTYYIVIGMIAICAIISIYFIIKYKFKGILAVLSFAANISLYLLIIRLTKIEISLNGFAGMLGLIILNTILLRNILECITNKDKTFGENIKNAYLKTMSAFVIVLIIFAVFAFSKMTVINSMGLLMFWGWIVIVLGNLVLTLPMLSAIDRK